MQSISDEELRAYNRYQDSLRDEASYVETNYYFAKMEGKEDGRIEGRVEGESRLLRRQLERRFGVLPEWALERLESATEDELEVWSDAVLTASTLEAVLRYTNLS